MMKDLNDFYLQKENVKNELKLLEKEENEGMETLEKNYLLEKKRIRDQFEQKKEKLWKEKDEIEKKITLKKKRKILLRISVNCQEKKERNRFG